MKRITILLSIGILVLVGCAERTPQPEPEPVAVLVKGTPPCTLPLSEWTPLDLGLPLKGCYTDRAIVYTSDIVNRPFLVANLDSFLATLDGKLLAEVNVSVEGRDRVPMYLVHSREQLDQVKEYLEIGIGSDDRWIVAVATDPGDLYYEASESQWAARNGYLLPISQLANDWAIGDSQYAQVQMLTNLIMHGYVHWALDYIDHIPAWMNEGLATYYEIEASPVNPIGDLYYEASESQWAARNGYLLPISQLANDWAIGDSQYAQVQMLTRYIVDTYGMTKIVEALDGFEKESNSAKVVKEVFDRNYAQFNADFTNWLITWGEDDPRYMAYYNGSSGDLGCHEPCRGREDSKGDPVLNLTVKATFTNPTKLPEFEYGFVIRDYIYVGVTHEQIWQARAWTEDWRERTTIGTGSLDDPFAIGLAETNHLRVTARDEEGCLYVNNEYVACFDLPDYAKEAVILIYSQHGDVWYDDFTVEELPDQ